MGFVILSRPEITIQNIVTVETALAQNVRDAELHFPKCPSCKSDNVVPIFYGYYPGLPSDLIKSGEFDLCGCELGLDDPDWHCKNCDNKWRGGEKTIPPGWIIDVDNRTIRVHSASR